MMELPLAKRVEQSKKLIAALTAQAGELPTEELIVLIYNNAIEDCVAALNVYAEKNPEYRRPLAAAAQEIAFNWPLVKDAP
jgi:hypothetical protein